MTETPHAVPMLTAAQAAAAASRAAGVSISKAAFLAAAARSKELESVIGEDGVFVWPEPAVHAFGLTRIPVTEKDAEEWGSEHGLMTARQSAAAAEITYSHFSRAVSDKTLGNPAPDPLSPEEIAERVPHRFRRWAWFRADEIARWSNAKPGKGNREPKRLTTEELGPDEWTAQDCADAFGWTKGRWLRHVRTEITANPPQPTRKKRSAFIWSKSAVLAHKAALDG
ncbi:hypothetical protein ACQP2U_43080 (plasmid) [Nocardia sp. CA-084685]|uniref:hypothetical protein n=1 Tax=Nocardia sp. CA-084685 TaxID=3239970 RepID=UPI003D9516D2